MKKILVILAVIALVLSFGMAGAKYVFAGGIEVSGDGTFTVVTAEQLTSTDDALVTDDLTVDGGARIDETATVNALIVNTTVSAGGRITSTVADGGNSPFVITSSVVNANLNADKVDGKHSTDMVLRDGTQALSANWDAGSYKITAETLASDVATGTSPLTVVSRTLVSNLNADSLDGKNSTDFVLIDGSQGLSADWDAGSHKITAQTLKSDVASGTAPFEVASGTVVPNLNVDSLDGKNSTDFVLVDGTQALTGDLSAGTNKITSLKAPTTSGDAARIEDVWTRANKSGDTFTGDVKLNDNKFLLFGSDSDGKMVYDSGFNVVIFNGSVLSVDQLSIASSLGMATGSDLTATGGSSDLDFSASSGITKTTSGENTIEGAATFAKSVSYSVNATTVLDTTLISADIRTVYPVDASGGNRTLTLPDAATVAGRMYMVSTAADPGANFVLLTATGGDKLGGGGGATVLVTTDSAAGMTLVSDGVTYAIVGTYGSWTTTL